MTGMTGSGKSTTLASMIDYRNQNEPGHIITIEDPIEYFHSHKKSVVTQREVGVDTESFSIALKNSLRQRLMLFWWARSVIARLWSKP